MATPLRHQPESGGPRETRFTVPSEVSRVGEVVEMVVAWCTAHGPLGSTSRFRLCTVVAEAVANAIIYGNNHDPARVVTIELQCLGDRVVVGVLDEGQGYVPDEVPDPTIDDCLENTCGRGLFMIRHLADHVAFNAEGNAIWMTLPRC
jgi:serine/threonine-protein kinase RsbW